MPELKPCPYCGGKPIVRQVGDWKQLFVFFCSDCAMTPVRSDEARSTIWGAKRIWNRRVDDAGV